MSLLWEARLPVLPLSKVSREAHRWEQTSLLDIEEVGPTGRFEITSPDREQQALQCSCT